MRRFFLYFAKYGELSIVLLAVLGELYTYFFRPELRILSSLPLVVKLPQAMLPAIWSILVIGGFTLYNMYVNMGYIYTSKRDVRIVTAEKLLREGYNEEIIYRLALCWFLQLIVWQVSDGAIQNPFAVASIAIGVIFIAIHPIDKSHWQTTVQHALSLFMLSLALSILLGDMGLVVAGFLHFGSNYFSMIVSRKLVYYMWDNNIIKRKWYFMQ